MHITHSPLASELDQALYLLPEAPLDADALQECDSARLQPLIDSLTRQLQCYLAQGLRHQKRIDGSASQHLILALNGPLGQGKSTVLNAVRRRLRPAPWLLRALRWWTSGAEPDVPPVPELVPTLGGDKRWPHVLSLDISHTKPEALEHFFWTLLLLRSQWFWFACVAVAVMWGLVLWWPSLVTQHEWAISFSTVITVAVSTIPAFNLISVVASRWLDWDPSWLDRMVRAYAQFFPLWPDVLLIDDLDRCRVEAQRSLLWALHQRTRSMAMAVVVAFDETDLLASEPAPESPEELLRKLVLASYRVPVRTAEDAAWLALTQCRRLAQCNKGHRLATALADVRTAALLARLCTMANQIGPRRMQALLHDAALATWSPPCPPGEELESLHAHMLLTALRQEAPALCRDGVALARVLESPTEVEIQRWLARLGDKHGKRQLLQCLVTLAPGVAPRRYGWHGLLAQHGNPAEVGLTGVARETTALLQPKPELDSVMRWTVLRNWRPVLDGVADEHGHIPGEWPKNLWNGTPRPTDGTNGSQPIPHQLAQRAQDALAMGWTLLCSLWPDLSAHARLVVCEWWLRVVLDGPPSPNGLMDAHSDAIANARAWRLELWRLWLTDPQVMALMPKPSLKGFFKRVSDDGALWLFVASMPAMPESVHDVLWHAVMLARRESGGVDEAWIRRSLQGHLPSAGLPRRSVATTTGIDIDLLANVWPLRLSGAKFGDWEKAVSTSTHAYADAVSSGAVTQLGLPALQAVMASHRSHAISVSEWLAALAPLLKHGEQWQPSIWSQGGLPQALGTPAAWWRLGAAGKPDEWAININSESEWLAALCLLWATTSNDQQVELMLGTLPRLLQAGYQRGHVLPPSLLADGRVLAWLRLEDNEADWQRRVRVKAWLRCQGPSKKAALANARTAVGAWLTALEQLTDEPAYRVVQQGALNAIAFQPPSEVLPMANEWDLHERYEWPQTSRFLSKVVGKMAHPHDRRAAVRWLHLAARRFDQLSIEHLHLLVARALTVLGTPSHVEDFRQLPLDEAAKQLAVCGLTVEWTAMARDALTTLQLNIANLRNDVAELPPPQASDWRLWLARWESMLGIHLPTDEDEAEREMKRRIAAWGCHLAKDDNAGVLNEFQEAVYAAVIKRF